MLVVALLALASAFALGLVNPPSRATLRDGASILPDAVRVPGAVGAVAVLSCVFIPTPLLALAAGFTFGAMVGTLIAAVGMTTGAAAQMALGAHLPRLTGRFKAVDRVDDAIRDGGWRGIVALRFAPGVPFALSNYALAAGSIPWTAVVLGTALGALPRAVVYATFGAAAYAGPTSTPCWAATALAAIGILGGAILLGPSVRHKLEVHRQRADAPKS